MNTKTSVKELKAILRCKTIFSLPRPWSLIDCQFSLTEKGNFSLKKPGLKIDNSPVM